MGLSRKDLWRNFLSNGMNSRGIHRRATWFFKMSSSRNTASYNWMRERERGENKRRLSDTQNPTGRKQVDNTTSLQVHLPSGKKKDDSKSEALSHTELFLGFETSWSWPSGFHDGLGLMSSFLLSFSPHCNGDCYNCSPVPDPPLHLGASDWLSSFTSTQMEKNWP